MPGSILVFLFIFGWLYLFYWLEKEEKKYRKFLDDYNDYSLKKIEQRYHFYKEDS